MSEEGLQGAHRLGLFLEVDIGTTVWSSDERKAVQTAEQIAKVVGVNVVSDPRLREVDRPFLDDPASYRSTALRYLQGEGSDGWEPPQDALDRFAGAVEERTTDHDGEVLVVVSHGLVTTLYLSGVFPKVGLEDAFDPAAFWTDLAMPDAWRLDIERNRLDRIGFTWDGLPIATEPPHGASILVYRLAESHPEFLLLHRAGAPPEGDWAWTPPGGARLPGEDVEVCAARELMEEAGLDLVPIATDCGSEKWVQFIADAPAGCTITVSDEHDAWEWVPADEACSRCRPAVVSDSMQRAIHQLGIEKGF